MQRKCQLSPFLFRSCQPAFSEKYLFLPEKPHRNDLNLKASSTSVSRKAAGLAAEGWGQLAGVPGPGLRLGTARPSPAPRAGTVLPQEAPCTPPCRCCSTEPGPHRAPAGLRRQHREGGRPRPRGPAAPTPHLVALPGGSTGRPQPQPSFWSAGGRSRVSSPLNRTYQALWGWVEVCCVLLAPPGSPPDWGRWGAEKPRAAQGRRRRALSLVFPRFPMPPAPPLCGG